MKFKIGDKVKVKKDNLEGIIGNYDADTDLYSLNFSSRIHYSYYGRELELVIDKKYITLADIKKHNPCSCKEYVILLERYGNDFKLTYEKLVDEFCTQKGWIEQHLSEFKEVPVYNGKFKVGDTVYISRGIGIFDKGEITQIYYHPNFKTFMTVTKDKDNNLVSDCSVDYLYSSLSELKKHWHHHICAIKDIGEEKSCSNCEDGRSKGFKCNRTYACETSEREFWRPEIKINTICGKCINTCKCNYTIVPMVDCVDFKEKECASCEFNNRNCYPVENYKCWKPKEK